MKTDKCLSDDRISDGGKLCTLYFVAELTIVVSQLLANSATMQFQLGRQQAQVSNTVTAPPSQQLKPGIAVRYLPDIPDFTTLR